MIFQTRCPRTTEIPPFSDENEEKDVTDDRDVVNDEHNKNASSRSKYLSENPRCD